MPRVVMTNRRLHSIPRAHRVRGGGSVALLFEFLGAFRAGVRCAADEDARAPAAPARFAASRDGEQLAVPIEFFTGSLVVLLGRIRQ